MDDGTCFIEGCGKPIRSRVWCRNHYNRWLRYGDPTAGRSSTYGAASYWLRFWEQIDTSGDCWSWTGRLDQDGYGRFREYGKNGRSTRSHRVAYEELVGPIPEGMDLDHLCHTNDRACIGGRSCPHRRCCNPDHLEPVPHEENRRRAGRLASGKPCRQGHPITSVRINKAGYPVCRECMNISQRRRKALKNKKPPAAPRGLRGAFEWKVDP